jgi:adenylate kinase family enzyme
MIAALHITHNEENDREQSHSRQTTMSTVEERKKLAAEQYLAQHRVRYLVETITADLVRFQPSRPLKFIKDRVDDIAAGKLELVRPRLVAVLGGPASGKGLVCAHLANELGMVTLAASELLRKEIREGTEVGRKVGELLHANKTVPREIVNGLIGQRIQQQQQQTTNGGDGATTTYAIDGFPRDMDQALHFEHHVAEIGVVVYLKTSPAKMRERMAARHAAGVQEDDDEVSQGRKIKTFLLQTFPVVEYYRGLGRLIEVNADLPAVDVAREVERQLRK